MSTTQTTHPWRAALRTGLAVFLSASAFLAVALPIALPFLQQYLPEQWVGYAVGAVGFVTALATVVNRLMLTTQFNDLLTKLGMGPAPAPAPEELEH